MDEAPTKSKKKLFWRVFETGEATEGEGILTKARRDAENYSNLQKTHARNPFISTLCDQLFALFSAPEVCKEIDGEELNREWTNMDRTVRLQYGRSDFDPIKPSSIKQEI